MVLCKTKNGQNMYFFFLYNKRQKVGKSSRILLWILIEVNEGCRSRPKINAGVWQRDEIGLYSTDSKSYFTCWALCVETFTVSVFPSEAAEPTGFLLQADIGSHGRPVHSQHLDAPLVLRMRPGWSHLQLLSIKLPGAYRCTTRFIASRDGTAWSEGKHVTTGSHRRHAVKPERVILNLTPRDRHLLQGVTLAWSIPFEAGQLK